MDANLAEAIQATFTRIARPLRWPMADFRRKKIANTGFAGYRFSRMRGRATAGFAFGFALKPAVLPGIRDPPEVVAYAFVGPVGSSLHDELVRRRGAPVRRLVRATTQLGFPFEFFPDREVVAVRHRSLASVPLELFVLAASDFFMIAQQPLRGGGFLEAVKKATTRPGP